MDRLKNMKKLILLLFISSLGYSQTIQHISNGETGLSTRNKLNSLIDTVNLLRTITSGTSTVIPTLQQVVTSNPIVNDPITSLDGQTSVSISNLNLNLSTDGFLTLDGATVTKNGQDIATTNQLPVLTASTNITISGTTPNYTVSSTTPTLSVVNGTLSGSYPTQTLTIPTSTASGSSTLTSSYIGVGDGSNNLSGSSALTYTNSILKVNATRTGGTAADTFKVQLGGTIASLGDITTNNQPTFIEFFKGNGSNAARTLRASTGFHGTTEVNQTINMEYRNGVHKYYDATLPAAWTYLGHSNGFGMQYVPANNPNSNIYNTYGCQPFKFDLFSQPSSGKGIDGFSKLTTAVITLVDATNTATLTGTPFSLKNVGSVLTFTGNTATDIRSTAVSGFVHYQTGLNSLKDLKILTSFTFPTSMTGGLFAASGTSSGANTALFAEALNGGVNIGLLAKSVTTKASGINIGVAAIASNTNATAPIQCAGYFGLTGVASPTALAASSALVVDNGTSTSNIFTLRDNATAVITVADGGNLTSTQNISSSSKTAGIGYAVGSGSTVTQATSRTTGVTINAITGSITLVSAAGSATYQSFTVTNSAVAAKDVIIVNQQTGTDLNIISVTNVAAGSFNISFATTGGVTVEQPIFNFSVIKGQTN